MKFLWPDALWLLAAVPLLAGLYVFLLRRRQHSAVRYGNVALVRDALGPGTRMRRHVPVVLLLAGFTATVLAMARPTAVVTLPTQQRTILMAIDVSLSMRTDDIQPTRMVAAKNAAKAFVQQQPDDVRIGIVSFSGSADLAQVPTRNKDDLVAAIDRLEPQGHTAIGSGMLVSLAALFPKEDMELQERWRSHGGQEVTGAKSLDARIADNAVPEPVPPGSYRSGAIILLTDGRRTTGPDPLDAARIAADHGVRVFTVGFGKAGGVDNQSAGSLVLEFDEPTLQAIADITRGAYFYAPTAEDLNRVYDALSAKFELERSDTEISAFAVALAAALMLAAGVLSLLWFGRLT